MRGEAAGDDYWTQLIIEAAVFSSGHPPTLMGADQRVLDGILVLEREADHRAAIR
jgi:hypothetical protein